MSVRERSGLWKPVIADRGFLKQEYVQSLSEYIVKSLKKVYFTPLPNINVGLEAFFALDNIDAGGGVFQGLKQWKYQFMTNILSKIVVYQGQMMSLFRYTQIQAFDVV